MTDAGAAAWHQRALAEITRWPWLQRLNDRASAVVDPVYDTHEPRLAVYVSDPYVSGRVEADLDGTVTEVYEAS